jgi:hypothetical protein
MKKILAEKYVDFYIDYLKEGFHGEIAMFKARLKLQEVVIGYMVSKPSEINIIQSAYELLKNDSTIQEKAQTKYELLKCDPKIYEKYAHLVLV